jgi:hypothetical protein
MDLKDIHTEQLQVYLATVSESKRTEIQRSLRCIITILDDLKQIFANQEDDNAPLIGKCHYYDLCNYIAELPIQMVHFVILEPNLTIFENPMQPNIMIEIKRTIKTINTMIKQYQKMYSFVRYYYLF